MRTNIFHIYASIIFVLALALLLSVPAATAAARHLYVSPNGNDTLISDASPNDCSDALYPCLTIYQAVEQSSPGDVVLLSPDGTHQQPAGLSALLRHSLTIRAPNGTRAIVS
jgi:hypothetical protein